MFHSLSVQSAMLVVSRGFIVVMVLTDEYTFVCADDNYPVLDTDVLLSILVVKHHQGRETEVPTHTKQE